MAGVLQIESLLKYMDSLPPIAIDAAEKRKRFNLDAVIELRFPHYNRGTHDGFLSDPLKFYFRLSGVPLNLCGFILLCAIIFLSRFGHSRESFRNYSTGIFVHFPKTLRLISFPIFLNVVSGTEKMSVTFFRYPKRHFYQSENTRPSIFHITKVRGENSL